MAEILWVDDEIESLIPLVHLLERGNTVRTASHSREALKLLEMSTYDFFIVDATMPGVSGLDVAKVAHEKYPQLTIILATGYGKDYITPSQMAEYGITHVSEKLHVRSLVSKK
jgi:YesN/AraC family two-component response regulator